MENYKLDYDNDFTDEELDIDRAKYALQLIALIANHISDNDKATILNEIEHIRKVLT